MFVCKTLTSPDANGLQTCIEWVAYSHPLAITQTEMIAIGGSLIGVAAVFIAYAIIAKATKLL